MLESKGCANMRTGTALDRTTVNAEQDKIRAGRLPTPGAIRASVPQVDPYQFTALTDIYSFDSDVQRSVLRHVELALLDGISYSSKNPEAAKALQNRLHLMAILAGYGNELQWMFEAVLDLAIYGNCFFFRRRSKADTGLRSRKARATIFYDIIPPETIRISLDGDRRIQTITANGKTYNPKDVIQLHILRPSGHLFGISPLFAALDDIRMVRGMEDITYEMVRKNLHPILHARVGVNVPVRVPQSDISEVDEKIRTMDSHSGYIVTRAHTELKMIGSESRALRTEGLLDRFRMRVYDSLNLPADRKRPPTRVPAEMTDRVKTIRTFGLGMMESTIFYELLLDEGFDPINNPADRVRILFNALDSEDQIKVENHQQQQYVQGLTGLNETRARMKLEPCDDIEPGSRDDFLYARERLPLALLGTSYAPGSTVPSENEPENQHGEQDGPETET